MISQFTKHSSMSLTLDLRSQQLYVCSNIFPSFNKGVRFSAVTCSRSLSWYSGEATQGCESYEPKPEKARAPNRQPVSVLWARFVLGGGLGPIIDTGCWTGAAGHWDALISHQASVVMEQSCQAAKWTGT